MCHRSHLEKLPTDHPEFCRPRGLTKHAIQRLTVGARVAIKMHSKMQNIQQLQQDLRNGPEHVFHQSCNAVFCTHAAANQPTSVPFFMSSKEDSTLSFVRPQDSTLSSVRPQEDYALSFVHPQEDSILSPPTTLEDHFNRIISEEATSLPTPEDERDAQSAPLETSTTAIPPGIIEKVKACGDRLIVLRAQLTYETNNLAETYMAI